MSRDLFGAAAVTGARPRRLTPSILCVSAIAHLVAFAVLVVIQLLAPGRLPVPAELRALAFYEPPRIVTLTDVALPAERTPHRTSESPLTAVPQPPGPDVAAPSTAPSGIAPETGNEGGGSGSDRAALAIEQGGGGIPEGIGVVSGLPTPPPQEPIRLHSGIRRPTKIVDVAPEYPPAARTARVAGLVIVEAVIDARGGVESARVLKAIPSGAAAAAPRALPLLEQAALDAVRRWKFTPTLLNGVAVPIVITVTVDFTLVP